MLLSFIRNPINWAPFGLIITKNETEPFDERFISIPLEHLLILR